MINFDSILRQLITNTGAEGAILISPDGLTIASSFSKDLEEDRVSAMGAAILSLAERVSSELEKGELEQAYIKGKDGYAIFTGIGDFAVLGVITDNASKLGYILLEIKNAIKKVQSIVK